MSIPKKGFFTYLYTMSILFFLYVFGYLLRSKRRKELKKRQKNLNKWRTANRAAAAPARSASVSVGIGDNDDGETRSASRRFINSIRNYRRRFSGQVDESAVTTDEPSPPQPNHQQQPDNSQALLTWTPSSSSLSLNLGDGDSISASAVSFAMNGANVIDRSGTGRSDSVKSTGKSKKMKVTDNEHSHGSFFLRAGAVGESLSKNYKLFELAIIIDIKANCQNVADYSLNVWVSLL